MSYSSYVQALQSLFDYKNSKNRLIYVNSKTILKLYSKCIWRLDCGADQAESIQDNGDYERFFEVTMNLVGCNDQINENGFESKLENRESCRCFVELVHKAVAKVNMYPGFGHLYADILNNYYLKRWDKNLKDDEVIEMLFISRAKYYQRKKEAVIIFGIILFNIIIPVITEQLSIKNK